MNDVNECIEQMYKDIKALPPRTLVGLRRALGLNYESPKLPLDVKLFISGYAPQVTPDREAEVKTITLFCASLMAQDIKSAPVLFPVYLVGLYGKDSDSLKRRVERLLDRPEVDSAFISNLTYFVKNALKENVCIDAKKLMADMFFWSPRKAGEWINVIATK